MQVAPASPAAETKQAAQEATGPRIAHPVSSPQVGGVIAAAQGDRVNVVDFPAKGGMLAVFGPADDPVVTIDPT